MIFIVPDLPQVSSSSQKKKKKGKLVSIVIALNSIKLVFQIRCREVWSLEGSVGG